MVMKVEDKSLAFPDSPAQAKTTYEEFLASMDEDVRAEWVDGEVIRMSPASQQHQLLASFLTTLLQIFVEVRQLGVVIPAPFQMKTGPGLSGREPDILFVSTERRELLKATFLDGPADLVVEIISPESRARDRGDKFYEYEQGGVGEYWLLDPLRRQAEFYQPDAERIYRPVTPDESGLYRSRVLSELTLKVDWLWQEPLPPLLSILKDWGLI